MRPRGFRWTRRSAYGSANASIAKMKVRTLTVPIAGTSSGNVIERNVCQWPAPSTRAASDSSSGTPPSAAPYSRTGNPTHCHALTRTTTHNAVDGSPSHGTASDPSPTRCSSALTGPNVGDSSSVHR